MEAELLKLPDSSLPALLSVPRPLSVILHIFCEFMYELRPKDLISWGGLTLFS